MVVEFDKTETLKFIHKIQREELQYRRSRELQVFTWSVAILLAVTAWSLGNTFSPGATAFIQTITGRCFASLAIALFTFFSVKWQLYHRNRVAEHAKVLVRIADFYNCFQDGYYMVGPSLLPGEWKKWGTDYLTFNEHIKTTSKITMTTLLGIIAIFSLLLM